MLRAIALFESRYYLRHPLFYGTTLLMGLLTFLVMTSDSISLGVRSATSTGMPRSSSSSS